MEEYQLFEIVETMFPQMKNLEFDGSGPIRMIGRDIQKVGVCVDVTPNVAHEAASQGMDYLIVHHPNGTDEKLLAAARNIGAYGIHLALDTSPGGLIDSLAGIFRFDAFMPIGLRYLGYEVPNGATMGVLPASVSFGYINDVLAGSGLAIQDALYAPCREVQSVIVSTGPAMRTEFLGQMKGLNADLFVAGSMRNGSKEFGRANDLQLIAVGDYESHSIGMKKFVDELNQEVSKYGAKAMLIPNA